MEKVHIESRRIDNKLFEEMPSSRNLGRRDSAPRRSVHFNFGDNASQDSRSHGTGNYDNNASAMQQQYKGNYVQTAR